MNYDKSNHQTIQISVVCMLLFLLFMNIPFIGMVANIFFWSTLSINFILFLYSHDWRWNIDIQHIYIIMSLLLWMLIRAQNIYGLKYFLLFSILMIIYLSNLTYRQISKEAILCLGILMIFFAIYVRITGNSVTNDNISALISAIVFILTLIRFTKYRFFIIIGGTFLLIFYGARSVILALVLSSIMIFWVRKKYIRIRTLLIILTITISGGLYVLWDFLMSPEFNTFVFEATNKNFQSGRELIWGAVFENMHGIDWLIGLGGGINHQSLVPIEYSHFSLHSTYVFMLFHYGLIGLSLLLLLFYKILKELTDKRYYYSATIFFFFVLRDFFEITLINNQMAIAVLFWGWIANGWVDRNLCTSKRQRISNYSIKYDPYNLKML